jgi:hypothetical protein
VDFDVPQQWRDAAEEVRAHLTILRGGGPFLSPSDSWQLVQWFQEGIDVTIVLLALERAAEARRLKRTRVPLSLVAAKRHLGKAGQTPFRGRAPSHEHPLAPVVRSLLTVPRTDGPGAVDGPARAALEKDLLAIRPGDPEGVRLALTATRSFFDEVWEALGAAGRDKLRTTARLELGDLVQMLDETELVDLVEEAARDALRARYPSLAAATFAALLKT